MQELTKEDLVAPSPAKGKKTRRDERPSDKEKEPDKARNSYYYDDAYGYEEYVPENSEKPDSNNEGDQAS